MKTKLNKTEIAAEWCRKYPEKTNTEISRLLCKKHPILFTKEENARSMVRKIRGANRKAASNEGKSIFGSNHGYLKKYADIAEDYLERFNPFAIPETYMEVKKPFHFPKRNRLIAALSIGTLIVEATIKSGSLISAKQSANLGREVFAIPRSIEEIGGEGCHYLIKNGAKLTENIADILDELKPYQGLMTVKGV